MRKILLAALLVFSSLATVSSATEPQWQDKFQEYFVQELAHFESVQGMEPISNGGGFKLSTFALRIKVPVGFDIEIGKIILEPNIELFWKL